MPRIHKHLTVALALFALLGAQVFGLQRGYVCDCGGVEQQTAWDHCHGPHSEACHDHEGEAVPHDHDSDAESQGCEGNGDTDTHHHAPFFETLNFAKAKGDVEAPAITLAVIAELAWVWAPLVQTAREIPPRFAPPDDRSPPECLRVAASIVMLI